MSPPPLRADDCLFVDLDGTLLHLRDDPHAMPADPALRDLLQHCAARLGGALAIISGRPLAVIDACLTPVHFPAAGLHGLERRDFYGMTKSVSVDRTPLQDAALQLTQAMEDLPMTTLENKGASLALHWRRAPQFESALRQLAQATVERLGAHYHLLDGNCVVEVLPDQASKGDAVRAFMAEMPFEGRRPVVVGDDITDLTGFEAARALGGSSVAVGPRVRGDFCLRDVGAVRSWLRGASHG